MMQRLKATIAELVTATEIAERAVAGLKVTAHECEETLGERLKAAERFCGDMNRTRAGDMVIDRLARIVAPRDCRSTPKIAASNPIRSRSRPQRGPLPSARASASVRSPHDPPPTRFPAHPGRAYRDDLPVRVEDLRAGIRWRLPVRRREQAHGGRKRHHRHDHSCQNSRRLCPGRGTARAPTPAPKRSWAQEMFNFPDVTGSTPAPQSAPPAEAGAAKEAKAKPPHKDSPPVRGRRSLPIRPDCLRPPSAQSSSGWESGAASLTRAPRTSTCATASQGGREALEERIAELKELEQRVNAAARSRTKAKPPASRTSSPCTRT